MAKTFFLQTMSLIFHRYAAFFLQKDVLQPFQGRACTYNIQNFIAVSTISLCMDRNTGKVSMVWFIFNCIFVFYFYFVLEGYNKNILFEYMFSTFFLDNEIFIQSKSNFSCTQFTYKIYNKIMGTQGKCFLQCSVVSPCAQIITVRSVVILWANY